MNHTTYLAYGAKIHDPEEYNSPGLGVVHLLRAGGMAFLVTHLDKIPIGTYESFPAYRVPVSVQADWDLALLYAAKTLGVTLESAPGWIVVPDAS